MKVVFGLIFDMVGKVLISSYKLLDQYIITNFVHFIKGFELVIFIAAAVVFVLMAWYIAMRQARRLPKSYYIEIIDPTGAHSSIDGMRQFFSTYNAAESYARFYRELYNNKYTFRVVGRKDEWRARLQKSRLRIR